MRITFGQTEIQIGDSNSNGGRSSEERIEIAEQVRDEGRETLNKQIETLSRIDEKAGKMMRVNILFLGIILSGFSFLIGQDIVRESVGIFNNHTVTGLVLTVLSIAFSSLAYTASNTVGGIKGEEIKRIYENEYTRVQLKEGVASSYEDWIKKNREPIVTNSLWFNISSIFLAGALVFLSIGIIHAVAFSVSINVVIFSIGILFVYSISTGVFGHLFRWYKITDPVQRFLDRIKGAKNYVCGGQNE